MLSASNVLCIIGESFPRGKFSNTRSATSGAKRLPPNRSICHLAEVSAPSQLSAEAAATDRSDMAMIGAAATSDQLQIGQ